MVEEQICASCKRKIAPIPSSTVFSCPNCGKHPIARCGQCRKIAAKYICQGCNFEGPN